MLGEDDHIVRQAFRQVGLGLPINSSKDHEFKIKDFSEIQVGNLEGLTANNRRGS